ncbi:hypothetical protein HB880_10400 [Listeria welshimeri]|nr:hypothetical protein [Listeria welshimeri]
MQIKNNYNEGGWREFSLNDKAYFDLKSSKSVLNNKDIIYDEDSKFPYVTRSNEKNGIQSFISKQKVDLVKGNVIIIGLDTQTVFYQRNSFYTGQNVQILESKYMNELVGLFLVVAITKQLTSLNWGGNGATLSRLQKKSILLPSLNDHTPDWDYMRKFIQNKMVEKRKNIQVSQEPIINNLSELLECKWGEFKIGDLFDVEKGEFMPQKNIIFDGKTPFISAKKEKNGIRNFVGNKPLFKGNKITIEKVNFKSHYQPADFYCSHDVSVLKSEKLNEEVGLFISTMINRQASKYSYGKQAQLEVVKREKVLLPITKNNEPDYEYMEAFIKRQKFLLKRNALLF